MNRIMYIQGGNLMRIGRVRFSKSKKSVYYEGQRFLIADGRCFGKANFYNWETGGEYWISGPKKDGTDALYGRPTIEIDEDVREEYWTEIRKRPDLVNETSFLSEGKYTRNNRRPK